jgi:DNA-binding NarL/FixJ family response regulator
MGAPAEMHVARVLLADDHESVRSGLRFIIDAMPGWEVCGEAATGREAVDLAIALKPEIIVMDMSMPGLNGLDATRQIRKQCPGSEILAFTGLDEEALIHEMFEAGARGYLLKTDTNECIQAALRALAQHKSYFTAKVGEVLFAKFLFGKDNVSTGSEPGRLSSREREVVQLLAEGRSNKEVGSMLGISMKTAETHRAAVMKKLDLASFADLVRYAIRNHIISA